MNFGPRSFLLGFGNHAKTLEQVHADKNNEAIPIQKV
jgi:hypothetical protein